MPKKYVRRPLPLYPRGSFRFTDKTVSIDVSTVVEGPEPRKILHVSRSRGAIEFPDSGRPAQSVDLAIVLSILETVDAHRIRNFEAPVSTLFEPRLWQDIKRTAASTLPVASGRIAGSTEASSVPFPGRPTKCFESRGIHPDENLWVATDTGEAVLESVVRTVTEAGRGYSVERRFEIIDAKAALAWLEDEQVLYIPSILVERLSGRRRALAKQEAPRERSPQTARPRPAGKKTPRVPPGSRSG
jgi:hypothetical protein